jgi:hypothetical protein
LTEHRIPPALAALVFSPLCGGVFMVTNPEKSLEMIELTWIKDFLKFGFGVMEARCPFRIRIFVRKPPDQELPVFYVELINKTKDRPLFVHAVRVHFGNWIYNNSFVLAPQKTIEIVPGANYEFFISYKNSDTQFQQVVRTKSEKVVNSPGPKYPTFDSAVALFKAIANGNERDSWIEVDFNAFKDRRFCRGKVKKMFGLIISHAQRIAPS